MWTVFVSLRYLLARRREKFVSIISLISVLGVAVGVAALIVVLSVMTGFDEEIKEKIIGTYSHIVILNEMPSSYVDKVADKIKGVEDIVAYSPFLDMQSLLKVGNNISGVLVRAVDPEREPAVSNVNQFIEGGKLDFEKNGIILGSEIRKNYRINIGDTIELIAPQTEITKKFVVRDVFNSGRYDYDSNIVLISLESARKLYGDNVTGIGIRVKDEFNVRRTRNQIKDVLGFPFLVKTWQDLDRNLMRALAVEKKIMFFILALIIIVACFNIASTLIMIVMEKTKDIGILKSIGATRSEIRTIFIMNGFFIGFLGIAFGVGAGFAIAVHINEIAAFVEQFTGFSLFPSDIYYLSDIPSKIEMFDVARVALTALFITILAAFYPAWQAARLNPVEAIRYE
jgi:lipoprotein-releasing system permease protein